MHAREMLVESIAYLAPAKTLDGLTPAQAEQRVAGAPHSIAEILAHMTYWQDFFVSRCEGTATPMPTSAAAGWPEVAPGSWPTLRQRFLDSVERLAAFEGPKRLDDPLTPPIAFPAIDKFTFGDVFHHVATHNAHHFGQIILLRQMQGLWPPPAGSWTW